MAKNQTYRAFTARPSYILDLNGELLDSAPIMAELASEVRGISSYATYVVRNDVMLAADLAHLVMLEETLIHYDTPTRVAGLIPTSFWVGSVVTARCTVFIFLINCASRVVCLSNIGKVFAVAPRVIYLAFLVFL